MNVTLSSTLTTGEAAKLLGVDARTVQRWARAGRIRSFRDPAGNYRYDPADLTPERLLVPVTPKGVTS